MRRERGREGEGGWNERVVGRNLRLCTMLPKFSISEAERWEEVPLQYQELVQNYLGDEDFGRAYSIKDPKEYSNPKHADAHMPEYKRREEMLFFKGRLCVPRKDRLRILIEAHDTPSAGHLQTVINGSYFVYSTSKTRYSSSK